MKKAIDIIEKARSYYLLAKDHPVIGSKPFLVGNRIKLEFALEGIESDMVIATSGNTKRCIILMDYTTEEVMELVHKANTVLLKAKLKN